MPRKPRDVKAAGDAEDAAVFCHVGRKLAVLRTARDFTQSDLARKTGVKRSSISEYESGLTTPDASTLERLLAGLQFPWSALDLAGWFLARLSPHRDAATADPEAPADAVLLERTSAEMRKAADRLEGVARSMQRTGRGSAAPEVAAPGVRHEEREAARALIASIRKLPQQRQEEKLRSAPESLR